MNVKGSLKKNCKQKQGKAFCFRKKRTFIKIIMMQSITEKNIQEFKGEIGATKLSNFYSVSEINAIENAIEDVSKNPSPMVDVFEKDMNGNTIFFNDFNNWRRIESLKSICLSNKLGRAFSKITGSSQAFLHDHQICKKAGATKKTPWHIDKSYFMVDSRYTASFWIPTAGLNSSQSLSFAKGSHKERKLMMPKGFKSNNPLESGDDFLPFNSNEIEENYEICSWEMNTGDVLVFDFYTAHSAPSCVLNHDRKALSLRLIGDGASFDARIKNPAPPFTQMGYRSNRGDPIKQNWFPKFTSKKF